MEPSGHLRHGNPTLPAKMAGASAAAGARPAEPQSRSSRYAEMVNRGEALLSAKRALEPPLVTILERLSLSDALVPSLLRARLHTLHAVAGADGAALGGAPLAGHRREVVEEAQPAHVVRVTASRADQQERASGLPIPTRPTEGSFVQLLSKQSYLFQCILSICAASHPGGILAL